MFRVKLSRRGPQEQNPHAPLIGGTVQLGTSSSTVIFLIDTGADSTLLGHHDLPVPVQEMKRGKKASARGVGGNWPTRKFQGQASMTILAEESDTGEEAAIKIPLPTVDVMAPHAEWDGEKLVEELNHVAPQDRRFAGTQPRLRRCPVFTPLLGRDVFFENWLKLEYSPREESWVILLQKVEDQAA